MADPIDADRSFPEPVPLVPLHDRDRLGAHLPAPLTSFVGREREVEQVCYLLRRADVRLVTLTGTGGVGRLHLEGRPTRSARGTFVDGVASVDLAPLAAPTSTRRHRHPSSVDRRSLPSCLQEKGSVRGGMGSPPISTPCRL